MSTDELYQRHIQPLLIVISGPSGVGKDTIAQLQIRKKHTTIWAEKLQMVAYA